MSNKRKILSLGQKVAVIRALDSGEKQCDVVKRFELSQPSVSSIWKNKEKILGAYNEGTTMKKIRKPKFDDLDQAMLLWFQTQRSNNIPMTGPIIKMQAEQFSRDLGLDNFKASDGWLTRFKNRHCITYGKIKCKAQDGVSKVPKIWLQDVWQQLMIKYSPDNIFKGDETGIFFKLTPDKTFKFKGEKCIGGKLSKERITVFVAANMTGSEKRKLLIIGNLKNPRCFRNVKKLPVTYQSNKSAWMTPQIFEEELRKWDAELKNRKILLLVDGRPAHPAVKNLKNIELVFLSPNSTSVQPMDQSVIRSLKNFYRRKLVLEMAAAEKFSMNILKGIHLLKKAWDEVTPATIQHSFRHFGLYWSLPDDAKIQSATNVNDSDDNLQLDEFAKLFQPKTLTNDDITNFINFEEDLVTSDSLSDGEIIKLVQDDEAADGDEDNDVADPEQIPTMKEALEAAKILDKFVTFQGEDDTLISPMSIIYKKLQFKYLQRQLNRKKKSKTTEPVSLELKVPLFDLQFLT